MNPFDAPATVLDWFARIGTLIALGSWLTHVTRTRLRNRAVRRFFGGTEISLVLPLRTLQGRTAVAEPDYLAARTLETFLATRGIRCETRFVGPEEPLSLGPGGHLLICGPKSSADVAERMSRDPRLRFTHRADGWRIVTRDTGLSYRSRNDSTGEDSDIGYLSRTREAAVGGDRTVVTIAGVHAQGSAIVAAQLAGVRPIRGLLRRARGSGFSAVIGGSYAEHTLRVLDTAELGFFRHPDR
ncbi:hypothetical protein [Leucobacter sp. M11]|uniref:hypothetical protein n=1 Tax=Leucobacter sp. M11 TaxID=2993565 RepID=UPI002D804EDF|nr:hypothetical protein [Leucobacter sp. M11]MEB4613062.1 hypothetical protein [Leucobacter sp. M11]